MTWNEIRYRQGFTLTDYKLNKDGEPVLKKGAKITIDKSIEYLPCGHMNNTKLPNRKIGICPKGCGDFNEKEEIIED